MQNWKMLTIAIIELAARDARRGDDAARQWLATDGAEILDQLGASVDVGGWLRELPDGNRQLALRLCA